MEYSEFEPKNKKHYNLHIQIVITINITYNVQLQNIS